MKNNKKSGYSLLELLLVVMIIGLITASLIAKSLNGIHQAKQIKTTSLLSGSVPLPQDINFKKWPPEESSMEGRTPTLSGSLTIPGTGEINCTPTLSDHEKEQLPVYDADERVFLKDAWGTSYRGVKCSGAGLSGAVCVTSAGSDREFEEGPFFSERYPASLTFRDICICDGEGVNRGYLLLPDPLACAKEGKICRPGLCCPGLACGTNRKCA